MNQALIRTALKLNAAFSGISGFFLLLMPEAAGQLLGINTPMAFQAVGIGLLIFSTDLLHQSTRDQVAGWRVLYATIGDLIWVLGSILGVIFWSSHLHPQGIFTILTVAALVLCFGVAQIAGLKNMYFLPKERCFGYSHRYQSVSDAESLWHIIGDLGAIAQYAPNLASSRIEEVHDDDLPLRVCADTKGNYWRERCTEYDENCRRYEVEFLTKDDGFPYPATWMIGGWRVERIEDGSDVVVWWKLRPKPAWLAPAIMAMLAFGVERTFPDVIRNMEKQALSSESQELANSANHATA